MADKIAATAIQTANSLQESSSLAEKQGMPTLEAICIAEPTETLGARSQRISDPQNTITRQATCEQHLCFSFFFDGTGNNMDADEPTEELSNVARPYLAHPGNEATKGIYRIYIPGIGTRFKDIGDPGGTTTGLAFGADGEKRLK